MDERSDSRERRGARVAFLGNSIIYFNDTPRFLVQLGKKAVTTGELQNNEGDPTFLPYVEMQDSCLRGWATLTSLWNDGNGMLEHGFATERAKLTDELSDKKTDDEKLLYDIGSPTVESLLGCSQISADDCNQEKEIWDFVVMNDYTQGPARTKSREESKAILIEKYAPLFIANRAIPVFIETWAYKFPGINNSEDLGSTHGFQKLVHEGIESYIATLKERLPPELQPRMAPVGTAFLRVHDKNNKLWEDLFDPWDNFHPSPSGSFLQGCVLHCTMFGRPPPLPKTEEEITSLWSNARVMHLKKKVDKGVRLPTVDEAKYLWGVAKEVCDQQGLQSSL
mmetsp:Transcript_12402/g.24787  ORF Transcript_12402/g.24787 Transcript_12402/m.24787 type:complete len:338 (-) Transcript_12402:58-1071(-)|eukprot:CAMPEP_0171332320 /NCGR_PEP_ID=MMETSP0878-20121228/3271_1 /TAXON_ID=67004 /ORGANISM="Thalassiosira weissflogii, Strain CCMP1336" /LENGTH=337 /DNA_ID=CAMNT_0011833021 /DNA_START=82 /DNA_END=1095 /DNA_ORIENTATION=+